MPKKDVIGIKFGVTGGGSISGESGRLIKSQLESIVSQIKLKVNVDQEHFRKQVALLKKELDNALGKLKVGIKASTGTPIAATTNAPSKGSSSKISDEQKAINTELKAEMSIRKQIAKIGEGKREIFKAQLEKELSAHENIRQALKEQVTIAKEKIQINTVGLPLTEGIVASEQGRLETLQKELGLRQLTKGQLLEIETITERTAAKEQDMAEEGEHRLKTKFMGVQAAAASLLNRYKDLIKHNQDAAGWAGKLGVAIDQTFDDLPVKEKNERLREFVQLVREADTNFNQLSVATDTFATKLRRVFQRRVFITLSVLLVGVVMRAIRQVYRNVVDLDTAMTNLRTTIRMSERTLNDFSRSAAQSAKRLSVSIIEVVEATTAFVRLGYNPTFTVQSKQKAHSLTVM